MSMKVVEYNRINIIWQKHDQKQKNDDVDELWWCTCVAVDRSVLFFLFTDLLRILTPSFIERHRLLLLFFVVIAISQDLTSISDQAH